MSLGHVKESNIKKKGSDLPPTSKPKAVHYSTMQNKPIVYTCLEQLVNRLMLDIDIPRYFYLDLTTESASESPWIMKTKEDRRSET